jgi:hypothetical protein
MPICRNFQKNLQTAKKDKMAFHLNLFFQFPTSATRSVSPTATDASAITVTRANGPGGP